jgi:hypothetical protein
MFAFEDPEDDAASCFEPEIRSEVHKALREIQLGSVLDHFQLKLDIDETHKTIIKVVCKFNKPPKTELGKLAKNAVKTGTNAKPISPEEITQAIVKSIIKAAATCVCKRFKTAVFRNTTTGLMVKACPLLLDENMMTSAMFNPRGSGFKL